MSDWFVEALRPAMATLGMSEEFVGLVIVAIAGNAVENVVGIQMAIRNKPDLAISLILNEPVQVAIALTPALVLISLFVGGGLTLVLSPLLLAALTLAALLDGAHRLRRRDDLARRAGPARPLPDHRRVRLVRRADPGLRGRPAPLLRRATWSPAVQPGRQRR